MELETIVKRIKDSGHTAYKIAEATLLTEVGINKILNGTSLNPRKSTLKILEDYIKSNIDKTTDTKEVTQERQNPAIELLAKEILETETFKKWANEIGLSVKKEKDYTYGDVESLVDRLLKESKKVKK